MERLNHPIKMLTLELKSTKLEKKTLDQIHLTQPHIVFNTVEL